MGKSSTLVFAELRQFLNGLGFRDKQVAPDVGAPAWVFRHPKDGLIIFRLYGENELVDEGDVRSTRRFLDLRGVLEAEDFDAFLHRATPA